MKSVRIWFEKKGAACYISHLDLTRCMSRALKLSRLPVWYTEGFNPRIYMTYAMPLSLGVQGERECMDIRLTEERDCTKIIAALNEKLPKDIRALHAAEPRQKLEEIAFADYELFLEAENVEALKERLDALFSKKEILVIKHGKKGDKQTDIKPFFENPEMIPQNDVTLKLSLRLPCSVSGSVNPGLLLEALRQYEGVEPEARIIRKRLLTKEFSEIQ
ncbi:TIGR03936 family radical SAM-associated protein [Neglectibacter caecimuris]|uniref:TIGR03936 family radical SAM-associated protein n=1 Tax=Neglectibacter caecimuris TaxID=3093658 RepID=UPI002AC98ED1|nr:TIGR03936 family radical SAM-associated protein [Neglectibacter sp. M00184]